MKLEPPATATTSRANDSSPSSGNSVANNSTEQQARLLQPATSSSASLMDTMDKVRRIDDTVERVVASLSTNNRAQLEQQLGDDPGGGDFLHVNANLSFNSSTRAVVFEDLPENFLENISPQQGGLGGDHHAQPHSSSPMLASLAPMSLQGVEGATSSGYVTLVPMATPTYVTSLKMELPSGSDQLASSSAMDSSRTGPASGLLPPLHLTDMSGLAPGTQVLVQQNGGSQPHFIKLELAGQHHNNTADTPPAVSTVELANNLIASMLSGGDQQHVGNTIVLQSGTQPRRMAAGSGPPLTGQFSSTCYIPSSFFP
jgi:hypothetical protein